MSGLRERARRSAQDAANEWKLKTAAAGPPVNSERRYLRREDMSETTHDAIARAQSKNWWPDVLGETPQSDARWWWWFVPEGLGTP